MSISLPPQPVCDERLRKQYEEARDARVAARKTKKAAAKHFAELKDVIRVARRQSESPEQQLAAAEERLAAADRILSAAQSVYDPLVARVDELDRLHREYGAAMCKAMFP